MVRQCSGIAPKFSFYNRAMLLHNHWGYSSTLAGTPHTFISCLLMGHQFPVPEEVEQSLLLPQLQYAVLGHSYFDVLGDPRNITNGNGLNLNLSLCLQCG
jgi:hypothetical protein